MTNKPDRHEVIKIQSEEQAWIWFEKAMNNEYIPEKISIVFDGWPKWEIKFDGKDWDSTVPTRVMAPLLEIQKDLNRVYTQSVYGTSNTKRLTNEQRDTLELIVKVGAGSALYSALFDNQLTSLANVLAEKMSSTELLILIFGLAFTYGGVSIGKAWIAKRQQDKASEQTVLLSEQETERVRLYTQAATRQPIVNESKIDYDESSNRLLKVLKPRDKINISGVELDSFQAQEISQSERGRSEDIDITGIFRVLMVDTTKNEGFRIRVSRISDGEVFNVTVPIELPFEQQKLIQAAEWSRGEKLINMKISASILRGSISDAKVYSVEKA